MKKQETDQGPAAPGTATIIPWAGTPFEAEYQMLAAGMDRERANVNRLADALEAVFRECEQTCVPIDCVNDDPERCDDKDCWPCLARKALRLAGRHAAAWSAP